MKNEEEISGEIRKILSDFAKSILPPHGYKHVHYPLWGKADEPPSASQKPESISQGLPQGKDQANLQA